MANGNLNRIKQSNLVCKMMYSMKNYYGMKIW